MVREGPDGPLVIPSTGNKPIPNDPAPKTVNRAEIKRRRKVARRNRRRR